MNLHLGHKWLYCFKVGLQNLHVQEISSHSTKCASLQTFATNIFLMHVMKYNLWLCSYCVRILIVEWVIFFKLTRSTLICFVNYYWIDGIGVSYFACFFTNIVQIYRCKEVNKFESFHSLWIYKRRNIFLFHLQNCNYCLI
jgi:hypothetical protein